MNKFKTSQTDFKAFHCAVYVIKCRATVYGRAGVLRWPKICVERVGRKCGAADWYGEGKCGGRKIPMQTAIEAATYIIKTSASHFKNARKSETK